VEVGEHERWPYAMYDRSATVTWAERFSQEGLPPTDVANWVAGVAQGWPTPMKRVWPTATSSPGCWG
jgi:hypothetical protein